MQPVMTALAQGSKDIRVEKDAIACIKVTLQGTREVVAAPITNIIACMRNEGVEENNIDLNGLYTYIGAIDRKKLEAYQSKGLKMWKATQGPGDLMYIPAGYVQVQRVLNNGDNINIRYNLVVNEAGAKEELTKVMKFAGKSQVLSAVLDTLSAESKAKD